MKDIHRNEIQRLRQAGMGYLKIAQELSLSPNTVKAYCRRNGLAGARATKEAAVPFTPGTQAENFIGHTGRINLISGANRGNSSVAERSEPLDFTGFSATQEAPQVDLVFAEKADEKAIHEILGMLLRENYCDK